MGPVEIALSEVYCTLNMFIQKVHEYEPVLYVLSCACTCTECIVVYTHNT